jgi:hypothetical protein
LNLDYTNYFILVTVRITGGVIMTTTKKDGTMKINYTRRGGIYVKPSDIAKTRRGKKLIESNKNSKLAKSIRAKKNK